MPETVLAAVLRAPRTPLELREYPVPDLPPGAALLRTAYSEVCGTDVHLWHGRLTGVPYPIIPGHVSAGVLDRVRGPLASLDGSIPREGDRVVFFDVHRTCGRCRACTGQPYADTMRRAPRLRDHRFGRRRVVRRLGRSHLPRARSRHCNAARPRRVRGVHRRRVRPDHSRPYPQSCGAQTRRSRGRAGDRRRRTQRHRARAVGGRVEGFRDRRSGRSTGARATDGRRRGDEPGIVVRRGASGTGPRIDRRRRRRRGGRGRGLGTRRRGGPGARP